MRLCLIASIAFIVIACNNTKETSLESYKHTNELVHETSPYLLQHAHNPVNWKPWGDKALSEAKDSKKLMVISIGYAACHWCHVMERESFEDSAVAAVMNNHFVSIKVDREERPDVDQTYINAVQLMTGSAGWPLNVITLPDGRPIFGGTYFRKNDWIQALEQVQELYETSPEKLLDYASKLEEGIKSLDLVELNSDDLDFKGYDFNQIILKWKSSFDSIDGGTRGAPKFMMPNQLHTLLRWGYNTDDVKIKHHVLLSLEKMAYGGIYDQIGGGFARYSTDDRWHVPHFEKMLYDNAQLVSLYSEAYRLNPDPLYQEIVSNTLQFIAREFTGDGGMFYSSLDADSHDTHGELSEGAYYTYSLEELHEAITEDWELFEAYFNINELGLWKEELKYVLLRNSSDESIAQQFGVSVEYLKDKKTLWVDILLNIRKNRDRPRLDDKSLTSWNALMLTAYVDAYKTFGNQEYLDAALKNAIFLKEHQLQKTGALFHTYKNGKSSINGYLEDYSATVKAFLDLYEVTFNTDWLNLSKQLTDYALDKFYDEKSHMFYFTSEDDPQIISRTTDFRDNVIPSSNSIMAKNLFLLSHHFYEERFDKIAHQMLKNVLPELERYPTSFSNWMDLMANYRFPFQEVVVVGDEATNMVVDLHKLYLPNQLIIGSKKQDTLPLLEGRFQNGKTYIYVCVNNTCKLPVDSTFEAINLLK